MSTIYSSTYCQSKHIHTISTYMSTGAVFLKHLVDHFSRLVGVQVEQLHVGGQQNALHLQRAVREVLVQRSELLVSGHAGLLTHIHSDLACEEREEMISLQQIDQKWIVVSVQNPYIVINTTDKLAKDSLKINTPTVESLKHNSTPH